MSMVNRYYEPIKGLQVYLEDDSGSGYQYNDVTNAQGLVYFPQLPMGNYELTVNRPDSTYIYSSLITLSAADVSKILNSQNAESGAVPEDDYVIDINTTADAVGLNFKFIGTFIGIIGIEDNPALPEQAPVASSTPAPSPSAPMPTETATNAPDTETAPTETASPSQTPDPSVTQIPEPVVSPDSETLPSPTEAPSADVSSAPSETAATTVTPSQTSTVSSASQTTSSEPSVSPESTQSALSGTSATGSQNASAPQTSNAQAGQNSGTKPPKPAQLADDPYFDGSLVNYNNIPIADATILSKNNTTKGLLRAGTNEEGMFSFAGITDGRNVITADNADGTLIGTVDLDVVSGDKTEYQNDGATHRLILGKDTAQVFMKLQSNGNGGLVVLSVTDDGATGETSSIAENEGSVAPVFIWGAVIIIGAVLALITIRKRRAQR